MIEIAGSAGIWVQHHTIYYRPVDDENTASSSNVPNPSNVNKVTVQLQQQYTPLNSGSSGGNGPTTSGSGGGSGSGGPSLRCNLLTASTSSTNQTSSGSGTAAPCITSSKKSSKSSKQLRKKTELWHEGIAPNTVSALKPFLMKTLPTDIVTSMQDASMDALCMLRIINALNRYWEHLYGCVVHQSIIPQSEFLHAKLTAKANRQLQDPLVIMTGNLPQWLLQIGMACPFLFPFETRHLLFYATSFDRDRALQRLLDTTPDLNSTESSERVAPRLDRRKRCISRNDILKQAEQVMQEFGHSKALLEIQYENEVRKKEKTTFAMRSQIRKSETI